MNLEKLNSQIKAQARVNLDVTGSTVIFPTLGKLNVEDIDPGPTRDFKDFNTEVPIRYFKGEGETESEALDELSSKLNTYFEKCEGEYNRRVLCLRQQVSVKLITDTYTLKQWYQATTRLGIGILYDSFEERELQNKEKLNDHR